MGTGKCAGNTATAGDCSCPDGWALIASAAATDGTTKEDCCKEIPPVLGTCMNWKEKGKPFTCPDGWQTPKDLTPRAAVTFRAKTKCVSEIKCVPAILGDLKCPAACVN